MNWYLKVLRQYSDFEGRARRKEYWTYLLFNVIFSILVNCLDYVLGTHIGNVGLFSVFYMLAMITPGIAVSIRRLHDIGRSGWYFLLLFIPVIGILCLTILAVLDSQPGENKYGSNPKEASLQ